MTPIRTLLLATAATLAAMALGASAANATEGVEASVEGGEHCSVALENCVIEVHGTQEITITAHLFGMEFVQSGCESARTAYFDENGSGEWRNQIITQHSGDTCGKTACGSATPPADPWPFQIEEDSAGEEQMEYTFCLENLPYPHSNPTSCTIDVDVVTDHHDAEFTADGSPCHGPSPENPIVEVDGHWISEEGSDEIALAH
jgi:hypothetical protein